MSLRIMAAAVAISAVATGAQAVTLDILSVTGKWINPTQVQADFEQPADNMIRWGSPATDRGKSGYDFIGNAPPTLTVSDGATFSLGTFTHINNPIRGAIDFGAIDSVDLEVSINIDGYGIVKSIFEFDHWETLNSAHPCADGGTNYMGINKNGCADRVTATLNAASSDILTIEDVDYQFDILGFFHKETLFDEFWTKERKNNSAVLKAEFKVVPPEVVPLPATALLLLGGLGSLAAFRRRKS